MLYRFFCQQQIIAFIRKKQKSSFLMYHDFSNQILKTEDIYSYDKVPY